MKNNKGVKKVIANLALTVTRANTNSACIFVMHQEKLPKNAKKLRKF